MFTVQVIEVLGTPLVTGVYVRNFVDQNCINTTKDVEKLEPLTDGFTHFQLIQKTMNTHTQYMSANITLSSQEQFPSTQRVHEDMTITNDILGMWGKEDNMCHAPLW